MAVADAWGRTVRRVATRRTVGLAGVVAVVGVALTLGVFARPGVGAPRSEPSLIQGRAAGLRAFVEPEWAPEANAPAIPSPAPAVTPRSHISPVMAQWGAVVRLEWPPATPPDVRDYLGRIRPVQARFEGLFAYFASLRMQLEADGAAAERYWTALAALDEVSRDLQTRLDGIPPPESARAFHEAFRRTLGDFALSAREILVTELAGPSAAGDDPSSPARGLRYLHLATIEYQYLGTLLENLLRPYADAVPSGQPVRRA